MTGGGAMKDLDTLDRACEAVLSLDDNPGETPLWHFTGPEALKNIVTSGQVWATHYRYSNDPEDMLIGEKAVAEVVKGLANDEPDVLKRALYVRLQERFENNALTDRNDAFLVCLTEADANSLPHWSGYGSRGSGYAVQLAFRPPPEQNPNADLAVFCFKVVYNRMTFCDLVANQLDRFAELFRAYKGHESPDDLKQFVSTWMLRECAALSPRLKHHCFDHEREWRLVFVPMKAGNCDLLEFRVAEAGLVPYVPVDNVIAVEQVVVGPARADEHLRRLNAVRMLLAKKNIDPMKAKLCDLPFRG